MTRPHALAKALLLPVFAALTLSISTAANAADGYLVLNTIALHFKNTEERNTFTPGIGWEYSPSSCDHHNNAVIFFQLKLNLSECSNPSVHDDYPFCQNYPLSNTLKLSAVYK